MARRVFLGLTEVAGYFSGLEAGMRRAGIDAKFYDLSANPQGYRRVSSARAPIGSRLLRFTEAPAGSLGRRLWELLLRINRAGRQLRALLLLPIAVLRYDTFVLAGGGMFLDGRELPLLSWLGKRVVVVFTGSDHRPPYLNGLWARDAFVLGFDGMIKDTKAIHARVRRVERSTTAIVALPASAQFHERPFFDFLSVGFPYSGGEPVPEEPGGRNGPVRILHCPTRPVAKGSAVIREAIRALQAKGHDIEFVELTGRPHAEVLAALGWCDFVVDETYSDSPMAGFATEAANHGRPAVVAGYFASHSSDMRPANGLPPSMFVTPDRLMDAIEQLVTDTAFRMELGRRASDYVRDVWEPSAVARRIMRIADGDAPPAWLVDPKDVTYVHGWGMPEHEVKRSIGGIVRAAGIGALRLSGRPDLQARLLELGEAR
jgi:hypothetical protein